MATVELRGVGKRFGTLDVITGVDLQLDDGSLTVFVGPSGCGKSTLLRMIAGLEAISRGDILIGGRVVNQQTPTDRGIAMVFQNYALYPHMTVRQNIGFPLRMAGLARAEVDKRVDSAAERLQIDALLTRRPAALSGGQRQRVAIGRAIVRDPTVFLFDEPLSNLDADLRVQMRLEIAKLHRSLDSTMIYVTHDQVEALTLADRIVVLRAGAIEQTGSPMALYDDPDNMFVAGFIGSPRMNFLRGTVTGSGAGVTTVSLADFDDVTVAVAIEGAPLASGQAVTLGVRPESLYPQGTVSLAVEIDVVESLGAASFAYGRSVRDGPLTIDLKGDRTVRAGMRYETGFDPRKVLVFDARTERRLR